MHDRVNICNLGEESPGIWTHTPRILVAPEWHIIKYVPHALIGTPMHNITVWDY